MFERYTEKARRAIFFARYEASQYGSPKIETQHLLLGILRENTRVSQMLPFGAADAIRAQVDTQATIRESISTSVDLPLSKAAKLVLEYAAEEADRLNQHHIGVEHLFLAFLRDKDDFAAKLLEPFGVKLEQMRTKVAGMNPEAFNTLGSSQRYRQLERPSKTTISIHGSDVEVELIRRLLVSCHERNWLWRKASWKPRDCVIERKSGKVSLDLSLAEDSANFELIKDGWKKDPCMICRWELFESANDAERGTGYTNGHDWICLECYDKFWQRPDFISGSYSEIT
jgi:Clp amino terminal domain, pathogenicity island component